MAAAEPLLEPPGVPLVKPRITRWRRVEAGELGGHRFANEDGAS